jgi:hypothetical protein
LFFFFKYILNRNKATNKKKRHYEQKGSEKRTFTTTIGDRKGKRKISWNAAEMGFSRGPINHMMIAKVTIFINFSSLPRRRGWDGGDSVGDEINNFLILNNGWALKSHYHH